MRTCLVTALAAVLLVPLPASAWTGGRAVDLTLTASDLRLEVDGESTLHAWTFKAGSATLTARVLPFKNALVTMAHKGLSALDLVLSVDSLKSPEGGGMDRNMLRSLEANKFPEIRFILTSYQLESQTVTVQGNLSIHGRTHPVTLTGKLAPTAQGLSVQGSYTLKMSDFGVPPPVMLLGTIRVTDSVKVSFSFKLTQPEAAAH